MSCITWHISSLLVLALPVTAMTKQCLEERSENVPFIFVTTQVAHYRNEAKLYSARLELLSDNGHDITDVGYAKYSLYPKQQTAFIMCFTASKQNYEEILLEKIIEHMNKEQCPRVTLKAQPNLFQHK